MGFLQKKTDFPTEKCRKVQKVRFPAEKCGFGGGTWQEDRGEGVLGKSQGQFMEGQGKELPMETWGGENDGGKATQVPTQYASSAKHCLRPLLSILCGLCFFWKTKQLRYLS